MFEGFAQGMGNLFSNPLFLEYLSGAGASVASGQGPAAGLDAVTKRQIGAANTMKMLQGMLGQEGKATIGGDGSINIKSDMSTIESVFNKQRKMDQGGTYGAEVAMNAPGGDAKGNYAADMSGGSGGLLRDMLNPSRGYLGNPDLAGLSSGDILNIFGAAQTVKDAQSKNALKMLDLVNEQAAASQAATTGLDAPFPIEVPGVGQVTTRQWNAQTSDMKEYARYVDLATKAGDKKIMSFEKYKNINPTDKEKFIERMMDDPRFKEAAIEYAESGGPGSYKDKLELQRESKRMEYQQEIMDWLMNKSVEDADKLFESNVWKQKEFELADQPEKLSDEKNKTIIGDFKRRVLAAGGKFTDEVEYRDGEIEFTIELPSLGTKMKYVYVVR